MQVLFKPEVLFFGFLFVQFAIVFFVAIKYIIDKVVERRFEELHEKAYPDAQIVSSGKKIPFFKVSELIFLIVGPALMAVTMVYSVFSVLNPNTNTDLRSRATDSKLIKITDEVRVPEETIKKWQKVLDNVPVNPNQILATASANGVSKTLTSGRSYPYEEVTFSWSGDRALEKGTKITGYFVYFGTKNTEIPFPVKGHDKTVNPQSDGVFIQSNSFTAKNMTRGKTYYFYVQAVSNSTTIEHRLGLEQVGYMQTLPAKKLFIYKFE
jgi:hypothetical protein